MLVTTRGKYEGRSPKYGTTSRIEGSVTGGLQKLEARRSR
jgi:hypothetical protein